MDHPSPAARDQQRRRQRESQRQRERQRAADSTWHFVATDVLSRESIVSSDLGSDLHRICESDEEQQLPLLSEDTYWEERERTGGNDNYEGSEASDPDPLRLLDPYRLDPETAGPASLERCEEGEGPVLGGEEGQRLLLQCAGGGESHPGRSTEAEATLLQQPATAVRSPGKAVSFVTANGSVPTTAAAEAGAAVTSIAAAAVASTPPGCRKGGPHAAYQPSLPLLAPRSHPSPVKTLLPHTEVRCSLHNQHPKVPSGWTSAWQMVQRPVRIAMSLTMPLVSNR